MGMYTQLVLAVELKDDTPESVLHTLRDMIRGLLLEESPHDHELFSTDGWSWMLKSDSAYFPGHSHSNLELGFGSCQLTIRSNFKNYGGELGLFLDWIKPYVYPQGYAGYQWYEEAEEPTPIYF